MPIEVRLECHRLSISLTFERWHERLKPQNEFATLTWRYGAFSRIRLTGRSRNDARRGSRYTVHVGVPSLGYRRKSLASAPASATRIRCPLRRNTDVA